MISIYVLNNFEKDNNIDSSHKEGEEKFNEVQNQIAPLIDELINKEESIESFKKQQIETLYGNKPTKAEKIENFKNLVKQIGLLGINISFLLAGKYASYYFSPNV